MPGDVGSQFPQRRPDSASASRASSGCHTCPPPSLVATGSVYVCEGGSQASRRCARHPLAAAAALCRCHRGHRGGRGPPASAHRLVSIGFRVQMVHQAAAAGRLDIGPVNDHPLRGGVVLDAVRRVDGIPGPPLEQRTRLRVRGPAARVLLRVVVRDLPQARRVGEVDHVDAGRVPGIDEQVLLDARAAMPMCAEQYSPAPGSGRRSPTLNSRS
jgi:hypothetical protein